jgi:hypothetical protein
MKMNNKSVGEYQALLDRLKGARNNSTMQIDPQTSVENNDMGLLEPGNIDIYHRPHVKNADGSISTVRSAGVNLDGDEVLLPTVSDDGRIVSVPEAVENYRKTGRHLGIFKDADSSTAYAKRLHNQQEDLILRGKTNGR